MLFNMPYPQEQKTHKYTVISVRWLATGLTVILLLLLVVVLPIKPFMLSAQQPVPWPDITLTTLAESFERPVHITHAGDGSERLFVVEQRGRILLLADGKLLPEPFLDIRSRVNCCGERGLLSVAFPPDFAQQGLFYVNYTRAPDNATQVSRFAVSADPNRADPGSEQVLLTIAQPFTNHNGGQLAFGPDGYLYIGMGDGGSGGDPDNRAQNPQDLLGKLLRIDVNHTGDAPYAIPEDNPFYTNPDYRDEIWALGLRNPWRFSFDRATGDLYIADVGQNAYEEINWQPASSPGGENYGWNIMEASHCYPPGTICDPNGLTLPVFEYNHTDGDRSITGGFVYRGQRYPALQGIYFYADYVSGRIWGLRRIDDGWHNQLLYDAPFQISTFGEDESGELYLADYSNGRIYQLRDAEPDPDPDPQPDYRFYLPLIVHQGIVPNSD